MELVLARAALNSNEKDESAHTLVLATIRPQIVVVAWSVAGRFNLTASFATSLFQHKQIKSPYNNSSGRLLHILSARFFGP